MFPKMLIWSLEFLLDSLTDDAIILLNFIFTGLQGYQKGYQITPGLTLSCPGFFGHSESGGLVTPPLFFSLTMNQLKTWYINSYD